MKKIIRLLGAGLVVAVVGGLFAPTTWAQDSFGFSFGYSGGGHRHGSRDHCGPRYYSRPGVSFGYSYQYYAPPPPPVYYYAPPPVVYRQYYSAPPAYYYQGGTYYSY